MFTTILAISRPRFWLYLAGPALIGLAASGAPLAALSHWQIVLFLLVWTLPANLFLYGVNDLADTDTDAQNEKKSGYEHRLKPAEQSTVTMGICISMAAVAIAALLTGSLSTVAWTAVFLILGTTYSLPPQRFKAMPIMDSASNVLYVLPGFAMAGALGLTVPLAVIVAAWAWAAGMHLFSAIPDIESDRQAGITTSAVALGRLDSLLICLALWFIADQVALNLGLVAAGLAGLVYTIIALTLAATPSLPIFRVYTFMPLINTVVGGILFWSLLL